MRALFVIFVAGFVFAAASATDQRKKGEPISPTNDDGVVISSVAKGKVMKMKFSVMFSILYFFILLGSVLGNAVDRDAPIVGSQVARIPRVRYDQASQSLPTISGSGSNLIATLPEEVIDLDKDLAEQFAVSSRNHIQSFSPEVKEMKKGQIQRALKAAVFDNLVPVMQESLNVIKGSGKRFGKFVKKSFIPALTKFFEISGKVFPQETVSFLIEKLGQFGMSAVFPLAIMGAKSAASVAVFGEKGAALPVAFFGIKKILPVAVLGIRAIGRLANFLINLDPLEKVVHVAKLLASPWNEGRGTLGRVDEDDVQRVYRDVVFGMNEEKTETMGVDPKSGQPFASPAQQIAPGYFLDARGNLFPPIRCHSLEKCVFTTSTGEKILVNNGIISLDKGNNLQCQQDTCWFLINGEFVNVKSTKKILINDVLHIIRKGTTKNGNEIIDVQKFSHHA